MKLEAPAEAASHPAHRGSCGWHELVVPGGAKRWELGYIYIYTYIYIYVLLLSLLLLLLFVKFRELCCRGYMFQ